MVLEQWMDLGQGKGSGPTVAPSSQHEFSVVLSIFAIYRHQWKDFAEQKLCLST